MIRYFAALLILPAVCFCQNIGLRLEHGTRFSLDVTLEGSAGEGPGCIELKSVEERCRQRLREVGVAFSEEPQDAVLWVSVGVERLSYTVALQFNRLVLLEMSDQFFEISATTWSIERFGECTDTYRSEVTDAVERCMDSFINEYLKQNGYTVKKNEPQ